MRTGALFPFAAAACSNQPLQLLLPTVLPRRSGVPVVAAAAVHIKSKKAKFSQKHPSKQQLKQQALKQMQQQQQAQPRKPEQQQQQQPKPAQGQQQQAQPRQQQSGQQQQQQSKQQQQQAKQQSAQQQGKQQQSLQSKQQNQQAHSKPPQQQQQRQQKTEQKQGSHKTGAGKQQQKQQQAAKPALASLQDLPASSTQKPLRQELPLVRPAQPAGAATSAAAAAAAAIQAAQQLLPPAAGDAQEPSRGAPAAGGGAATSSSSSSRPQQSPGKFDKVAGISYTLAEAHATGYKAAGVVLYDCAGPDRQPRLLLVREKNGVWNLPAGKVDRGADGKHNPAATAARELEEESHSLIPAAATLPVLASCPVFYCHASKMAIYLMRLTGGQQLPQLLERRLAAGMQHPMAEGVDRLGWFTADQISRGVMVSGKKGFKPDSSSSTLDTASASAAAAAAAGEGEEAAVAAAVLDSADVEQQLGSLQLQDGSPAAAIAQQQQQEELDGPLGVRVPLFRNIKKIRALLEVLAKGQAPELGLQVVQQQQQQQKATDASSLAPSFQQLQLPAKWAAYVNGASSRATTDSSSSGSRGGQEFLSAGGSASSNTGAAGQQRSPAAAAAGAGRGGSRSAGQQPWAIAVWSGQHDRQQPQQQSERW